MPKSKVRNGWVMYTNCTISALYPIWGKAVYLLGQTPESDNQIWHMPTPDPMPGKQFIELAASIYNVDPKYFAINKLMLQAYGLFNKLVKDSVEMYYQYNHDYNFNSAKFEKAFDFKPTTYQDGIEQLSETLYKPCITNPGVHLRPSIVKTVLLMNAGII